MTSSSRTQQVFVIGCPRSGTSAISWALAQHPDLWTSAESDFMFHLFRKNFLREAYDLSYNRPDDGWLKRHDVSYPEFSKFIGIGIDAMFRSRSNGAVWIDQTPAHTLVAPTLKSLFPDAKFIHIVRDGTAVVNSMLNSNFDNLGFEMKWTNSFEEACRTWNVYASKGHKFVQENPSEAMEVTNEELRSNGAETMSRITEFLHINPSDAPAQFLSQSRVNSSYDTGGKTVVSADSQHTKPNTMGAWCDWSDENKATYMALCGVLSKQLGYATNPASAIEQD